MSRLRSYLFMALLLGVALPTSASAWVKENGTVPVGTQEAALRSISCVGSRCTAVGQYRTAVWGQYAISETSGTWNVDSMDPNPGDKNAALTAVDCPSEGHCMAVGFYGSSGVQRPGAEQETSPGVWSSLYPTIAGSLGAELTGISCTSIYDCMAVGTNRDVLSGVWGAVALHWGGASWANTNAIPNPGPKNGVLKAVDCVSANDCLAVGGYGTSSGTKAALVERWNGSSWSVQPTLSIPNTSWVQFESISCPTTTSACWAVGGVTYSNGIRVPLIARWNGSSWTQEQPDFPADGTGRGTLLSINCAWQVGMEEYFCNALGQYERSGGEIWPLHMWHYSSGIFGGWMAEELSGWPATYYSAAQDEACKSVCHIVGFTKSSFGLYDDLIYHP